MAAAGGWTKAVALAAVQVIADDHDQAADAGRGQAAAARKRRAQKPAEAEDS